MEQRAIQIFENYIKPYSHGHCMHFSMLQPEMLYYEHPNGLISYIKKYGVYIVLSDPIFKNREKNSQITLLSDFLKKYNRVSFVQTSKGLAELLHEEFGFYATQIGNEKFIDLQNWKISGKKKQVIRTACNQAAKKKIKIVENPNESNFDSISEKWLKTRQVKEREIKFLVRTYPFFEVDTRVFCAYNSEAKLLAYIIFSPIFENGKCVGYVPDISRSSPEFKQGMYYAIMVEAIDIFKKEGKKYLNLGLSPLILKSNSEPFESEKLRFVLKLIRKYGGSLYNYNGINYTKSRFVAEDENSVEEGTRQAYFCHKSSMPIFKITTIFRASNVI